MFIYFHYSCWEDDSLGGKHSYSQDKLNSFVGGSPLSWLCTLKFNFSLLISDVVSIGNSLMIPVDLQARLQGLFRQLCLQVSFNTI
jgi:hypothetical protein